MSNDIFLRACRREAVDRTPVWIMRQAGRYLPEYRAIREKVDFLTLCKTPELASEVTVQPVDILEVDAAIVFSDILIVPEAMGMELVIDEGKGGPRFPNPIRSRAAIEKLRPADPDADLKFVMDSVRLTRQRLGGRVPLIGFAGSPWTLATYMVEGKGSHDFGFMKELIRTNPKDAHALLEKLASTVASYLSAKIRAGAQALQIFDTWGAILPPREFREFSLPYIRNVLAELRRTKEPVIIFCKGCGHSLDEIADLGAEVVGLDWTMDLRNAKNRVGNRVALQGNLDPSILLSTPETIRKAVKETLERFGMGSGHIFNLGHGILPETPVDNAREFVLAVKEESARFHR